MNKVEQTLDMDVTPELRDWKKHMGEQKRDQAENCNQMESYQIKSNQTRD